jgi:hypothetical protein
MPPGLPCPRDLSPHAKGMPRIPALPCATVQSMAGTRSRFAALALALSFPILTAHAFAQQPVPPDAGCVQQKGSYLCNWSSFKLNFERAHTVAVEVSPMDRPTAHQVDAMLAQLGKTHVPEGRASDLTVLLMPVDPTGVNIGPMDHELATLRIYAPGEGSPRGTLLWAETLKGQGDRPWPAQVHALISQFEDRFPKH